MLKQNRELEVKFSLSAKECERLSKSPRLSSCPDSSNKSLWSVYYDTPDYRLRDKGISLRVRGDGAQYIQTVKLDTGVEDGLSNPVEIENVVDGPQANIDRIGDKQVRRQIRKTVKGSTLTQAFENFVDRTTYRIRRKGSVIELAVDKGKTKAGGRQSGFCEAELELVKGNPRDLLAMAQSLFAESNVNLSTVSKAERGYRLLLGSVPSEKIEPVGAEPADIKKGQTIGKAFASILRATREQIVKNRIVIIETNDPEGAHQLRVGLTRLRSAHRALKPLIDSPQLAQLESDAQTISRAIGRLRDADVLIEDIYTPIAGEAPRQPGFDQVYLALQAHRAAMQQEARQALTSEAWSSLLLSLTLWPYMLEKDSTLASPVEVYAGNVLEKRWKNAAKLGRSIKKLEGDDRHRMRKALKKLRYMGEFVAPLYKQGEVKEFVRQLKDLQDVFGYVNDVAMAGQIREICTSRCGNDPAALIAAGYVLGWHEASASEVWKKAPKAWAKLKNSKHSWR